MANFAYDSMSGAMWQNLTDTSRTGGANWQSHPSSFGVFRIFEDRAYCEVAGAVYHKATPPSADYAVQAEYYQYTNPGTVGIAGRMSTSAVSYYMAYHAGSTIVLAKMVSGTLTIIDTAAKPWVAGNHTLRLEMVGTALGVYWDGAEAITATDGSITAAGKAGIRSGAPNDAHIGKHTDNWLAFDDTTLTISRTQVIGVVGI